MAYVYATIDYIRVANAIILAAVLIAVVTLLSRRGQLRYLTTTIKLSLVFYFLSVLTKISHFVMQYNDLLLPIIMEIILAALFLTNHWIFSWHFLEAACMMDVTFREHDSRQLALMSKRKKQLMNINVVGHVFLFAIYIALTLIAVFCFFGTFLIAYYGTMALLYWILAAVSMLAMCHIHANQKSLEQLQIYANKTLLTIYFLCWAGAALVMTVIALITIVNSKMFNFVSEELWFAFDVVNSIYSVLSLCLNCTILGTYVRFSNRLTPRHAEKAARSLQSHV